MTLFLPPAPGQAPAYVNLRDGDWNADLKIFAEELWSRFEPHAEPKFREHLSRDFHQRYWEMYLCNGLLNFDLIPEPQPIAGPDFKVSTSSGVVWIEATSPSEGHGQDAVPQPIEGKTQEVPVERILLRLTSAIRDKSDRFLNYQNKGIVPREDRLVIAVNSRAIPYSRAERSPPRILGALFPIGEVYVVFSREPLEIVEIGRHRREHLSKQSGATVKTTMFSSPEHSHISAVLSCNSNAGNHSGAVGQVGRDFIAIHNPFASNPIPRGILPCGQEWVAEDGEPVCYPRASTGAA